MYSKFLYTFICFYLVKNCMSAKEKYANLKRTIESIKKSCGDVCNQFLRGKKGEFFEEIHKNVECHALFNNSDFDKLSEFESPLMKIPKWLIPEYTYGDRVKIKYNYMDDSEGKPHNLDWSKNIKMIEEMMDTDKFEGSFYHICANRTPLLIRTP